MAHVGADGHGHHQPGASHGRLRQGQAAHDAVGAWCGAGRRSQYPLVMTISLLLKMAIEIVDLH